MWATGGWTVVTIVGMALSCFVLVVWALGRRARSLWPERDREEHRVFRRHQCHGGKDSSPLSPHPSQETFPFSGRTREGKVGHLNDRIAMRCFE